jgi:hypothetical protein
MTTIQFELQLIPHETEGGVINQRVSDGYVNATAMCKSAGKLFADYARLKNTQEFLDELSRSMGIPIDGLVFTISTGLNEYRGTWVHPDVAINLGQWLSPKFAVQVSKWIREWAMSGKSPHHNLPHHVKRYMANRLKIPHTHFSVLNEIMFNLIAPLEQNGYILPDDMVPDISEGKVFSNWLRKTKNIDPTTFPSYDHEYPDGRVCSARLYPNEHLADFKNHFNTVWLPNHAPKYFKERDKQALSLITRILLPELKK